MDPKTDPSLPNDDGLIVGQSAALSTEATSFFVKSVGLAVVILLLWASFAKVDRVTRGTGRIVSQEKNSQVQHYEGGIVTQILVAEGDSVDRGDVLLRIENSFAQAELAASQLELGTERLRRARLVAETQGADSVSFDDTLATAFPDQVAQEIRLFESRLAEREEQLSIVDDQVAQKEFELSEKRQRLANKRREKSLMAERLTSLRALSAEGAVARNELLQNETQFQQVVTAVSDLEFQIPQTESALAEVEGRRREVALRLRTQAEAELSETEFAIAKLEETIAALKDRKQRFDVAAPTSGTINKLFVNTLNGVVRPGQTIAEIVPEDAAIEVEAKLSPRDRAQVWPGLPSLVKVSAYDFTTFGGLDGEIVEISPDALQDEEGNIYFRIRIEASAQSFGEDKPVVPGMLAEVDIITGQQTILDYLLRPIRTVQAKALRE